MGFFYTIYMIYEFKILIKEILINLPLTAYIPQRSCAIIDEIKVRRYFMNEELIESFMGYLVDNERSSNTVEKYHRDLRVFMHFLEGREPEKKIIREYKQFLMERYAPKSVNSMLTALNSFFEYIGRRDLKVKMIRIQKRIFIDESRNLTKNEYRKLVYAARYDARMQLIIETLCSTGMRVSELKYITVENFESGQVDVYNKGKQRVIFLPQKLIIKMKKYIEKRKIEKGQIFVTRTGKSIDRISIWRGMKKLCKKAHIETSKVFPHNLRHLFAKTYYSVKKDLSRLADLLGHTNIDTTRIYVMENRQSHFKDIELMKLVI